MALHFTKACGCPGEDKGASRQQLISSCPCLSQRHKHRVTEMSVIRTSCGLKVVRLLSLHGSQASAEQCGLVTEESPSSQ